MTQWHRYWALGALAAWFCGCQPAHGHEKAAVYPVTTPLRKDVEIDSEYVAQIRAIQHIELRALERGYLTGIYVDEGRLIPKNTKMFQVLPQIYEAELNRAEAEQDLAKIEFQNTQLLADKNVVAAPELAMAKAKLAKAKAELSLAQARRKLTEIRAPFTGLMGRFQVRLGSLVEEGQLLTTLSDNSTVWVYFNMAEAEYLDYQMQAHAEGELPVRLRMANGKFFDQIGKIETIEADFNSETGNIALRAAFANPAKLLRHGETGNAILKRSFAKALLIPQSATFEILDRRFVFVIDSSSVARQRRITVAAEMPHIFIVGEGLKENEKILLDGLRKVRDGQKVQIESLEAAKVLADLEPPAE
mgnify:CR=1 FL=1